jgi:hypothetical protein
MPKSLNVDRVNTIMNFNSGILAYRAIQHQPGGVCCFCHQFLNMVPPPNPGDSVIGVCSICGNQVKYLTLTLSYKIAKYFDVRGPKGDLGVNGIMHVYLPVQHPEFTNLIKQIDSDFLMGKIWAAQYGKQQPRQEFYDAQEMMDKAFKKSLPDVYKALQKNRQNINNRKEKNFWDRVKNFFKL